MVNGISWGKGSFWVISSISLIIYIYKKKMHILDQMDWQCSHKLCRHGRWILERTVGLVSCRFWELQTYKKGLTVKRTPVLSRCSFFFFTCYHIRTHFTSQGQFLSRATRPGSLSVDYKHTQVACAACLSSDGHGGAGCLKGVCNTHMASLTEGSSVSDRHFSPHSAGWCEDS